jgi:UDP-N-acetylglucosamine 1-carboxyvinyltransferase
MRDIKAAQRFGKIIRDLRHQRKWTQDDLAAELEVDAAYISRIELGKKNISLETIMRLAKALDLWVSFGNKRLG